MISPIIKNQPTGRRNIPRYLYHLTTKENYNSMLKDGYIKAFHDVDPTTNLNGVFLFDMINFVKKWSSTGVVADFLKNPLLLSNALLLNAAFKNPEIVLLKIPTKNFPLEKLRCRVQNSQNKVPLEHTINGDAATNRKHFTRKKLALEYIFKGNIPINKASKIGEINTGIKIEKPEDLTKYYETNSLEILSQLLQNQPEQKSVELAKKSNFKLQTFED